MKHLTSCLLFYANTVLCTGQFGAGKTVRHNNWVYAPYPIKTATKAPKQAEYQVL